MGKIVINISDDIINIVKRFHHLLVKSKNFIVLFAFIFLLSSTYDKKYKKYFHYLRSNKKENKQINNKKSLKVCICTLGKNENKYIKEFVKHYKKLGVDKIFLHDNNDISEKAENFEDVISKYIKKDFVEIIDYRGKVAPQLDIYTECYKKHKNKFDWVIFFDIDEFIHLKGYDNIKDFLSEKRFNRCKLIYFNCLRHTDNDLLYYDNRSLSTRFPYINWKSRSFTLKTIARGSIKRISFHTSHWLDRNITGCNVFGEEVIPSKKVKLNNNINEPKFKDYYIDHYCFKSTEEYINKINKGDGIFGFDNETRMHKINLYFDYNRITKDKIKYIERNTGLNLSEFKLKLNENRTNSKNQPNEKTK